jgi:hypothetical protein
MRFPFQHRLAALTLVTSLVALSSVTLPAAAASSPSASASGASLTVPQDTLRRGRRGKGAGKEGHPQIRRAINALQNAKTDLQNAAHDFGGHRVDALRACDEAIKQLQLALQYDKK